LLNTDDADLRGRAGTGKGFIHPCSSQYDDMQEHFKLAALACSRHSEGNLVSVVDIALQEPGILRLRHNWPGFVTIQLSCHRNTRKLLNFYSSDGHSWLFFVFFRVVQWQKTSEQLPGFFLNDTVD